MLRRCSTLLWLGIGITCGAAGCSGEPVPALVAIRSQNLERPKPTSPSPPEEKSVEPQTVALGLPAPATGAAVDSAPGMQVALISHQAELPDNVSEAAGCNRRL